MVELKSAEQLKKATERAKAGSLFVRRTSIFRQYRVTNRETGAEYVVNFFVAGGKKYGDCTCQAGQHNTECKHLSAAAGLHVVIAAERAATAH